MLKYLYSQVYTKEIPNEISLGISITGCPIHCPECHSPYTWDSNEGSILYVNTLHHLIDCQSYISCILFFGGEWQPDHLEYLLKSISMRNEERSKNDQFKTALYTGQNLEFMQKYPSLLRLLDYIKVGPYDPILGSLDYPSTNQRLYTIENGIIKKDITSLFWRTNIK